MSSEVGITKEIQGVQDLLSRQYKIAREDTGKFIKNCSVAEQALLVNTFLETYRSELYTATQVACCILNFPIYCFAFIVGSLAQVSHEKKASDWNVKLVSEDTRKDWAVANVPGMLFFPTMTAFNGGLATGGEMVRFCNQVTPTAAST